MLLICIYSYSRAYVRQSCNACYLHLRGRNQELERLSISSRSIQLGNETLGLDPNLLTWDLTSPSKPYGAEEDIQRATKDCGSWMKVTSQTQLIFPKNKDFVSLGDRAAW